MDKELFFHTVATETAKAFTSSNMPEYINNSGTMGFAEDFAKKYAAAENYYSKNLNNSN